MITPFESSLSIIYEDKRISNFEIMPTTTLTSITTSSFTQDAFREGLKGAVSESFTFEMTADAQKTG